ncbi:hypothetical protein [Nonomuraea insulae]|uniref:Uncharacterized protein n=1 Tax=Nonomuraea insulae TaxID=1616787 RepID=A0ABW1CLG2_9ACTN
MLKEAGAIGVLVAALFAPSTSASAQSTENRAIGVSAVSTSLGICTSANRRDCKWMEDGNKRCYYCKKKKGGWKRQYCEGKRERGPRELECTSAAAPTATNPKRVCEKCVDQKSGKLVSTKCSTPG